MSNGTNFIGMISIKKLISDRGTLFHVTWLSKGDEPGQDTGR